jgi:hypothetical protein
MCVACTTSYGITDAPINRAPRLVGQRVDDLIATLASVRVGRIDVVDVPGSGSSRPSLRAAMRSGREELLARRRVG